MKDKRFGLPNGEVITRLRLARGWSQEKLSEKAKISEDSVKRAENCVRMRGQTIGAIANAFGVQPDVIQELEDWEKPGSDSVKNYTWEDVLIAAQKVAEQIFKNDQFGADAVLTYSGASLVFPGLVLSALPYDVFVRIPVYTAIFWDKNTPGKLVGYDKISTTLFELLIPQALTKHRSKRIAVIDESVVTGVTMKELRAFFKEKHYSARNVRFACCVAYDTRKAPPYEPLPEVIGLPLLDRGQSFQMPWGTTTYSFGDGFLPHLRSQQP